MFLTPRHPRMKKKCHKPSCEHPLNLKVQGKRASVKLRALCEGDSHIRRNHPRRAKWLLHLVTILFSQLGATGFLQFQLVKIMCIYMATASLFLQLHHLVHKQLTHVDSKYQWSVVI